MGDAVILRDLVVEGGLLWQGEEGDADDMTRYGHQNRWGLLGDMCKAVGQKVGDGGFRGSRHDLA